jgi:tRNA dimethylallyltransferase
MNELLVIVGPTAAGKTALALEIAPGLGAEIISADSRQVYRGMDVGTAKPTPEERRRVRHHAIDVVDPDQPYDVARYQRDAEASLADVASRGARPLVVGGTGLYVRALVDGLALRDLPHDPDLRARLEDESRLVGPEELHARLAARDPVAAARVHPRNVRRVIRYLEVTLLEGPISLRWRAAAARPVRLVGLLPPRDELDRRIDARVLAMVEAGVLDETRTLLARYGSLSRTALTAHGYPHWIRHLEGRASLDEATRLTQRDIRAYARRQLTWFRRDPRIRWFDPGRERRDLEASLLAA